MLKQEPGDIDLPIVYEDDNVVVINKPSGVLTQQGRDSSPARPWY